MSKVEMLKHTDRDFGTFTIPFEDSDAGRSNSKRPKQKSDCSVRSIALAFNQDYDDAYDYLKDKGRKASRSFDLIGLLDEKIKNDEKIFGRQFEKISFPARKGERRMNLVKFAFEHQRETYIVQMAKHVAVVKNGVIMDDGRPDLSKCVYSAYKVYPEYQRVFKIDSELPGNRKGLDEYSVLAWTYEEAEQKFLNEWGEHGHSIVRVGVDRELTSEHKHVQRRKSA